MAMLNISNISAVTSRMLGSDLGGAVASGVTTLLQSGGQESLHAAMGQLEKFLGPEAQGRRGAGPLAASPLAFQSAGLAATGGQSSGNSFAVAQSLQPKIQGMMVGLGQATHGLQQQLQTTGMHGQSGDSANAQLAKAFEATMDEAIRLHLSGNVADGKQAQALMQQALGMMPGVQTGAVNRTAPVSTGIPQRVAAGMPTPSLAPAGGGGGGVGASGSSTASMGGGLDAMMAQAESLLRSDSMESQLAGQRLMAKALRMFELISKMIEKQSEMASKAIAAIK